MFHEKASIRRHSWRMQLNEQDRGVNRFRWIPPFVAFLFIIHVPYHIRKYGQVLVISQPIFFVLLTEHYIRR